MALKVPPPIIAAIPKKVKSLTFKTLCKSVCPPSPPCFSIIEVDFFRNSLVNNMDVFLVRIKQIYKRFDTMRRLETFLGRTVWSDSEINVRTTYGIHTKKRNTYLIWNSFYISFGNL